MNTLKKLLHPITYFKRTYFGYIFTSARFGILRPINALLISRAIKGIEIGDYQMFKTYFIIFGILTIINYGTNYFIRTFRKITVRKFQDTTYKTYMDKYLKADNNTIETLGTGQANSIIQKGNDNRRMILHDILLGPVVRNIMNITIIFFLIITNLGITTFGIVVGIFLIMIAFARIGNKKMRPIRNQRRDVYIQADRFLVKIIMSKFEIPQNNKVIKELKKLKNFFTSLVYRDVKESKGYILASDAPRALLDFAKIGLVFRYGIQIFNGTAGFAEFTLIRMLMNQITGTLFELNEIMNNYFGQLPFVEKLRKTFDEIPKLKGYETGKHFKFTTGNIVADNIDFSYGDKNILRHFNLSIEGGKKTAFVGESGSGKSTLIKLLAGYIHPNKGNIIVDTHILSEVVLKEYYKHIGYLTQEPNVFDGSIEENLLYGTTKQPTQQQIKKAITSAKCEFIRTFKDGIQTQIGERGIRLSGGQKQRLAIAKLFLKNPKIIFLDEPTSSLDSFSEEKIAEALDNLFTGRTVIVVAHRLQTVKKADLIYVFNKGGKIVERGTHQQLLKKKGIYYNMIELQSGF